MSDRQGLVVLDRAECLQLLRSAPVGRLVFTEEGLPAVQPVNFRMHGEDVVIRVAGGGKLAAALDRCVVGFETDELDADLRTGWSVTVVGHASLVVNITELVEMSGRWLRPWADGRREHFVRIHSEKVTGRRLVPYWSCPSPPE